MINNEKEIWKSHPEYTGTEVSTLGRVRTLDRLVPCGGNRTRFTKGRVLKQHEDKYGYLKTSIPINGKWVTKLVHRLAAQTFLPNPDNLPQVNHKNCIRTNNNVENLEWCDNSYNQKYREKHGISRTEATGHPLFSINLDTLKVSRFGSQHEAGRTLGVSQGNINNVIKGKRNHAGGYWFTNADENADDAIKCKLHTLQSQVLGL